MIFDYFVFYLYFVFCLSAQRSVMAMMIIPLPRYDNLGGKCLKSGEKSVGVPPPPLINCF